MHAFHSPRRSLVRAAVPVSATVALVISTAGAASAHVGVELRGSTPTSGSGSTIAFRPGHGCDGDATNRLTVTIPDGIATASVKAQPKAGWDLTRDGATITWSGGVLPDDQFDEFALRVTWPKLPDGVTSQPFYFKTVQTCEAEITVTRSGKAATVRGVLPDHAGRKVALFVDDIPLTAHDVDLDADGRFTVRTTAAKVPVGSDVTARIGSVTVGNSVAATEAWVDVPAAGSTSTLAMPAPSVTVVAGTSGGH